MQRAYAGGASRDVKVPQHPELWYSFFLGGGGFLGRQFWLAFVVVALRKTSQVDRFVFF